MAAATETKSSSLQLQQLLLIMLLLLLQCVVCSSLSIGLYVLSCPAAELIVREQVRSATSADGTVPGKLLRLLFHDCFVEGCDASVLLEGEETERDDPANALLGGFQVIDSVETGSGDVVSWDCFLR
ncbi:Peroxidase 46-like protein [Drosera capensis]